MERRKDVRLIGLKEIQRRKLQFALIALVVTLIAYLVLMINGLGIGLNKQAGSALLQFNADAIAYSASSGLSVIRSELSSTIVNEVGAAPGVTASAPLGYLSVNTRNAAGAIQGVALLGYLPGQLGEPATVAGKSLAGSDTRGVLVDARFMESAGLSLGDTLTIINRLQTYDFTIVGEVHEGYFFFQPVVYMLLDALREVKYGTAAPATPLASIVLVKGKGLVGTSTSDYEIVSKQTAFANIEGVKGQQQTVEALRLFGFLIGAMVIGIFFYVLTLQKVQQLGTLKALGAGNGFLFGQMLLQVMTIIVVGVLVSTAAAWGTYALLSRLPQSIPIAFTFSTFVITSVLFIVTGLIGLVFSLRKVVRIDPIIAIGQQQ
jgi:putative ABC transport system permease protein